MEKLAVKAYEDGDYSQALKKFLILSENNDAVAQFYLGLLYAHGSGVVQDPREAEKWYRLAAEQGHSGAQNNLGYLYENALGTKQDDGE